MNDARTPRATAARRINHFDKSLPKYIVDVEVAEQLERELAAITCEEGELWKLRQENARMKDNLASLSKLHADEMAKAQKSFEFQLAAERETTQRLYDRLERREGYLYDYKVAYASERALADRLCACLERHAWLDGHETPNESEQALSAWKEARRDP